MLTIRALDEKGKWLLKARKVYDLDGQENRIKLPSGNYKSHKKNIVDWNDPGKAEIWRTAWADLVNFYLERADRPEQIDPRSYARQGKEEALTIHLGPAVSRLEQKGIQTEIGDYSCTRGASNRTAGSYPILSRTLPPALRLFHWPLMGHEKRDGIHDRILAGKAFLLWDNDRFDCTGYCPQKWKLKDQPISEKMSGKIVFSQLVICAQVSEYNIILPVFYIHV